MSKYKRDDKEFKAKVAKRFPKHDDSVVTATIDENGDVLFLATSANDIFLNHGTVVTKRASHVEPYHLGYRIAFHILRWFGDKTQIAEWTRNWPVVWRVNTKPVGGPILTWKDIGSTGGGFWKDSEPAIWLDRQEAIDEEIKFLNNWFLERGIR
jgi:hypothetical protein